MARNALVAYGQKKLDEVRRTFHSAAEDPSVSDDEILGLRKQLLRAFDELKEFDRRARGGFFSFLKFW